MPLGSCGLAKSAPSASTGCSCCFALVGSSAGGTFGVGLPGLCTGGRSSWIVGRIGTRANRLSESPPSSVSFSSGGGSGAFGVSNSGGSSLCLSSGLSGAPGSGWSRSGALLAGDGAPGNPLHAALLIFEGNSPGGSYLTAAGEGFPAPGGQILLPHLTVGDAQALPLRGHWQLSLNHIGSAKFISGGPVKVAGAAMDEVIAVHSGNGVVHFGVTVDVGDVDVVNDVNAVIDIGVVPIVPVSVVIAVPVPGVIGFIRRQRHPSYVPEAKAYSDVYTGVAVPAEEGHQGRSPVVTHMHSTRIPAPAVGPAVEPAAVVVRRPAPRIVADPAPSIPVNPAPPSITVGRPARGHIGAPNITVRMHVDPAAVAVEIFGAIDVLADVSVGIGVLELLIALFVPAVPVIANYGGY